MSSCVLCSTSNHGWRSITGRRPFYVIGCCEKVEPVSTFFPAVSCDFSGSRCYSYPHSQKGQVSFEWMRKSALSLDHLIRSEYSVTPLNSAQTLTAGCLVTLWQTAPIRWMFFQIVFRGGQREGKKQASKKSSGPFCNLYSKLMCRNMLIVCVA